MNSYTATAHVHPSAFSPSNFIQESGQPSASEVEAWYCTIPDPAPSAEEALDAARLGRILDNFVRSLKPRDRDIVHRVFWRGENQADVARAYGVSRAAINKTMDRICRHGALKLCAFRDCATLR